MTGSSATKTEASPPEPLVASRVGRPNRWPLALLGGQPVPGLDAGVYAAVEAYGPDGYADTRSVPVVFLPGLIGINEHWKAVVDRVPPGLPCLLFEPPLLKVGGDLASTLGWARITAEFLRAFVKRPSILVGSSFGGHVALRTAMLVPDLVRGIVLTGSSGMGEKSIITDTQVRSTTEWCRKRISELYFDKSHVKDSEVLRAHLELADRGNARVMIKLSKSARRDHLTDELHLVTQPVLLLWGKQDIVTPPAACRAFHSALPNARMVWVDRCGHVPMVEQPAIFAQALSAFADEVKGT